MSNSPGSVLDRLDIPLGPSEAHGLLCGLICSLNTSAAKTRWFAELLDAASLSADAVAAKAGELRQLDEWYKRTIEGLNDSDLAFMPELPDDEVAIDVRVVALGEFCAGFTYGLGIGIAQGGNPQLPGDTREVIEDFQAIDNTDTGGTDSTDEAAYVELSEYVRVGVLLVHEELKPVVGVAPVQASGANNPSIKLH
ncbi:MAG: UPF0149 family protein [Granulosicoccus sp.]